jgi:hypothetical protein
MKKPNSDHLETEARSFPETPAPYAPSLAHIQDKKAWLAAYRATTEELERLRAIDLATMTDEEALRRMKLLVVCGTPWRGRREWSGLIEQQAIFHQRRK